MTKGRLEAFSDAVIAIALTVMVLELKVPEGTSVAALQPLLPTFLAYVLSFVYLGIYWNNHHHMLHATGHINGRVLWANLHLLFWLSLVPFVTAWMGENHFASLPTAVYGVVMLLAAIAYYILQSTLIAIEGRHGRLAQAVGSDWKGKVSPLLYLAAIGFAFPLRWVSWALYAVVAIIWLVPDPRIEARLEAGRQQASAGG